MEEDEKFLLDRASKLCPIDSKDELLQRIQPPKDCEFPSLKKLDSKELLIKSLNETKSLFAIGVILEIPPYPKVYLLSDNQQKFNSFLLEILNRSHRYFIEYMIPDDRPRYPVFVVNSDKFKDFKLFEAEYSKFIEIILNHFNNTLKIKIEITDLI